MLAGTRRRYYLFFFIGLHLNFWDRSSQMNLKFPLSARLVSQQTWDLPISTNQCWDYRVHGLCPGFTWVLCIWIQILLLLQHMPLPSGSPPQPWQILKRFCFKSWTIVKLFLIFIRLIGFYYHLILVEIQCFRFTLWLDLLNMTF